MYTVDCQTHVFPEAYAELLLRNTGRVRTVRDKDGYIVTYGDTQKFVLNLNAYSPEKKLIDMDESGIDVSVLSMNIPGPEALDDEIAVTGARICNDYIAELCSRYPDRFAGLAVLPMGNVPASLEEYRRAVHELGLRGVILYSHIGGKPVDDPGFMPLYAQAAKDGIPFVIHPTVPMWGDVIRDYSMIPMLGLMVDHSIAMLRLILSGTLERYPDLLIVHPHCGGVLPYLMPRIEEQTEVKRRGREHIRKSPPEYYRNVYLDMVSPSPIAMEYAWRTSRTDRLLFGSDHPWVKISTLKDYVLELAIPEDHKAMILGDNARRLFRL